MFHNIIAGVLGLLAVSGKLHDDSDSSASDDAKNGKISIGVNFAIGVSWLIAIITGFTNLLNDYASEEFVCTQNLISKIVMPQFKYFISIFMVKIVLIIIFTAILCKTPSEIENTNTDSPKEPKKQVELFKLQFCHSNQIKFI